MKDNIKIKERQHYGHLFFDIYDKLGLRATITVFSWGGSEISIREDIWKAKNGKR